MITLNSRGYIFYISDNWTNHNTNKIGKWMYFFNNKDFISKICKKAIEENIVDTCKHTNDNDGVACFYIEYDNLNAHRKVINFFLENNLIPKTKNGRYYDISFKTDEQTLNGEYGNDFKAKMKLHQFIDLKNGKWIK
ncbi:MAG TPA: hypothetical protein DCX39_03150 [Firmicutes bacterium]|nr:hypothetical protein [Bacillota bacterium]HAX00137.1 hypothetical protein [Bacillota bacterium]